MRLDFTKEEIETVLSIISEYESVGKEMDELVKQSNEIQKRTDECEKKIDELVKREKDYLSILHEKYGKFNLQDISETIYYKDGKQ